MMHRMRGESCMKKKAVMFGAAGGQRLFEIVSLKYDVSYFVDNDALKWGKQLFGREICSPEILSDDMESVVVITSAPGLESIKNQCREFGIAEERIISSYVETPLESRKTFLKNLATLMCEKKISGECAEAGVFEGDFAKCINESFPQCKLYLFDTFEGFDVRDIVEEHKFSSAKAGEYYNTSIEKVLSKMPFPDKCKVFKGYFPETAYEIDEKFMFVNLDLDLYLPTYNGLKWFTTKMSAGGIILVHDYFSDNFRGPKEAVDRFLNENRKLFAIPIGDGLSIAIIGF